MDVGVMICRGCDDDTDRVDPDGHCVVCSPVEWFCDECPDHDRCAFKRRRDATTESLCDTRVLT